MYGAAALDLCYVAAGRADLFFELMLSQWDFAAANLIIKEAGGVMLTDSFLPADIRYKSGIVAGNSNIVDQFKEFCI